MSIKLPERPKKGAKIPHDYFQRMWDHQKSLELHGDLSTTTVKRDRSGTVVRAPSNGGGNSTLRAHAYIAEITADNDDGTYDALEQANSDGTYSDALATNGLSLGSATDDNGYLYELNGHQGVPVGVFVVVHRVANTSGGPIWYFDSGMGLGGRSFWAKITGETTGSYSWTELQGDATTVTSRTGTTNAEEVSGRLGIPTNSIVRMWSNAADNDEFKFEYHGANSGTLDVLTEGTISSPSTDEWDREDQAALRGVELDLVSDVRYSSASNEVYLIRREHTADANGHEETWGPEVETLLFAVTPSINNYPYKNCDDNNVVARFEASDLPTNSFTWLSDGTHVCLVPCYRDPLSSGTATSPLPCEVEQAVGSCGALTEAPFEDDFSGTEDTCVWTDLYTAGSASFVSGKYRFTADATTGLVGKNNTYPLSGDFTAEIEVEMVTFEADNTVGQSAVVRAWRNSDDASLIYMFIEKTDGASNSQWGLWSGNKAGQTLDITTLSSSTISFRIVRSGSTLTTYYNVGSGWVAGSRTETESGVVYFSVYIGNGGSSQLVVDLDNYTIT